MCLKIIKTKLLVFLKPESGIILTQKIGDFLIFYSHFVWYILGLELDAVIFMTNKIF